MVNSLCNRLLLFLWSNEFLFFFPHLISYCVKASKFSQSHLYFLPSLPQNRKILKFSNTDNLPLGTFTMSTAAVLSRSVLSDSLQPRGLQPVRLLCPWDAPGQNTRAGCHALLQGIFPTRGWNPGLPHCRRILYCLSHEGTPWIQEWVAYPSSKGSSQPRNWTMVSCAVGRLFTRWATREALSNLKYAFNLTREKVTSFGYRTWGVDTPSGQRNRPPPDSGCRWVGAAPCPQQGSGSGARVALLMPVSAPSSPVRGTGSLVPTPVHECLTCGHLGAEGCRGDRRAQGRGVRPLNKPLGTAALTWCWFCSAAQACPTLCNPMDCSTPGLPVHHQLPEFTQTHVHWVGDAIQPSHPLLSPSPPALSLSQQRGLF